MENGSRCHQGMVITGVLFQYLGSAMQGGRRFGKQAEDGIHACGAVLRTESLAAVDGTNAVYT